MSERSYRDILRSASIIGGSSVINVGLGLIRMKFTALALGPGGIGIIGLLQALMTTAGTIGALGFGTAGARTIAQAIDDSAPEPLAIARTALLWATSGLAVLAGLAMWALRDVLAENVLSDAGLADAVGWLGIGVAAAIAAGSQAAVLRGLRRIGDLGRINIGSALAATVFGILAVQLWGQGGAVLFVLSAPLAGLLLGHYFVRRALPMADTRPVRPGVRPILRAMGAMAQLGMAFMLSGVVALVAQLGLRSVIQAGQGIEAVGLFQAASTIGLTYIGFVLAAMGSDFYPRLALAIKDAPAANRLVNEQTEVALLLALPVLLAMMALAPLALTILFTGACSAAAETVRWQVLADVLKLASWPLGFMLMAAGNGRLFLLTEAISNGVLLGAGFLLVPLLGISGASIAYLLMYALYLPLVFALARRRTGFAWTRRVALLVAVDAGLVAGVFALCEALPLAGAVAGCGAAVLAGLYAVYRLWRLTGSSGLSFRRRPSATEPELAGGVE